MTHLAANGWVCVAANYQLSPRVTFPEHLIDCKRALRWIREHVAEHGGDPDFVVVTGGSAGGHLAALVGLTANDPAYQPGFRDTDTSVTAAVPIYGVYDMTETFRYPGASTRGSRWMERRVMGATLDDDPERFRRASPVYQVHAGAPPFFVIHGAKDNLVPVDQARRFVAALRAVQNPVAYAEIPGATHAFEIFHSVRTGNLVNAVDRYLAWLYSAYQAAPAAASPTAGAGGGARDGDQGETTGVEPTVPDVDDGAMKQAASDPGTETGLTTTSRTAPS
jgi:acetyl esterase/lipase